MFTLINTAAIALQTRVAARQEGQGMVEYILVVGLIALGATLAMTTFSGQVGTAFGSIGTALTTAAA